MKLLLTALGFLALLFAGAAWELPHKVYDIPSIQGRVLDAATGSSIAGARVIAHSKRTDDVRTAISDGAGRFLIEPSSHIEWFRFNLPLLDRVTFTEVVVSASAHGYQTLMIRLESDRIDLKLVREVAGQ